MQLAFWGMVWALTSKLASKVTVWPYRLIFCPQVEETKCIPPNFLEKIILITRIGRKKVFLESCSWAHLSLSKCWCLVKQNYKLLVQHFFLNCPFLRINKIFPKMVPKTKLMLKTESHKNQIHWFHWRMSLWKM